jgi:hypothetical protein
MPSTTYYGSSNVMLTPRISVSGGCTGGGSGGIEGAGIATDIGQVLQLIKAIRDNFGRDGGTPNTTLTKDINDIKTKLNAIETRLSKLEGGTTPAPQPPGDGPIGGAGVGGVGGAGTAAPGTAMSKIEVLLVNMERNQESLRQAYHQAKVELDQQTRILERNTKMLHALGKQLGEVK